MGRVVIIGIDGATWPLLEPWIDEGVLPNIEAVREKGASGTLRSTYPPDSIPAWLSMVTGKNPGRFGVFHFRTKQGVSNPGPVYTHGPWHMLEGKQMAFVNVPGTYPLVEKGVDGYVVSGLFTPEGDWETPEHFTYPEELGAEIAELVGTYNIDLWGTDEHTLLDRAEETVEKRTQVFEHLLEKDIDLFWGVYTAPDRLMHRFWAYQDPDHPLYDGLPEDDERREALKEHFVQIDEGVGQIRDRLDEDDTLILVSDHGFEPTYHSFDLHGFLHDRGYITEKKTSRASLLKKLGITRETAKRVFESLGGGWLLDHLGKAFRVRLRVFADRNLPRSDQRITIDEDQSKIIPRQATLLVNTASRGGPIPDEKREQVRDAVIADLRDFMEEHRLTGEVLPDEDFLEGPHSEEGPDVYWFFDNVKNGGTGDEETLLTTLDNVSKAGVIDVLNAWHNMDGIYAMSGPAIEHVEVDASIYDISPTMIHLLNASIPADCDGAVMDVFVEGSEPAEREVRREGSAAGDVAGLDL